MYTYHTWHTKLMPPKSNYKLSIDGFAINLILSMWAEEEYKKGNIDKAKRLIKVHDRRVINFGKVPIR
jgi:hypothetical protein